MTGGAHLEARSPGGLGRAVAITASCVVVAAVAVAAYARLTDDDERADLTDDELAEALLTEAEVGDAATAAGPYTSVGFDAAVDGLPVNFGDAEIRPDVPECARVGSLLLPGASHPSTGAAFRRSDGTVVLHTLDLPEDGDASVTDPDHEGGTCRYLSADTGNVELTGGAGGTVDLGDSSYSACFDAVFNDVGSNPDALCTVVVERDGVIATTSVIAGTDLSDESELARSLAEAADAKLASRL